jgi:hypothetical protein
MHAFVWNAATGITDLLDPSDSSFGEAEAENAYGDIAGQICFGGTCYAVLWRRRGEHWEKTNLSTATQNAVAYSINASAQVVGNLYFTVGQAAFLSEGGGPLVDLNTLVPPGSGLQLSEADQINDRGEISAVGIDANSNHHAVVLIPCDDHHPGVEGCDYSMVDSAIVSQFDQSNLTRTAPRRGNTMAIRTSANTYAIGRMPTTSLSDKGTETHTLTGYCFGSNLAGCNELKDLTQCPAGTVATSPVHETFYCPHHNSQQEYVDSSRGCQVKSRTGTVYGLCMVN